VWGFCAGMRHHGEKVATDSGEYRKNREVSGSPRKARMLLAIVI
jgi:hypothetical protein